MSSVIQVVQHPFKEHFSQARRQPALRHAISAELKGRQAVYMDPVTGPLEPCVLGVWYLGQKLVRSKVGKPGNAISVRAAAHQAVTSSLEFQTVGLFLYIVLVHGVD